MNKILERIIAALIVISLIGTNLAVVGNYGISYALTSAELSKQTSNTENKNIEFNSYFEGDTHEKTENIENTTAKMFVNIKVKNVGYLKDAVISFEDVNFKILELKNDYVQSVDNENNKIFLKQINNGSDVTIEVPISVLNSKSVTLDNFSKETKTILKAIYIDSNGKEKDISKEVTNKLSWTAKAEVEVESELSKYIPYNVQEKYGIILQAKINSGIKNSILPIKSTNLTIESPEINNIKPSKVTVISNTTAASNGKTDGIDFNEENYAYDIESGKVNINVSNIVSKDNKISWAKNEKDEYLISFIYEGKDIYDYATQNDIITSFKVADNIKVYGNEESVDKNIEKELKLNKKETIGELVDYEIKMTNQISKGQIYANYEVENKKEVNYDVFYLATICSAENAKEIEFIQAVDKLLTADNKEGTTTINNKNYVYNKTIKINQKLFNKILGEDGTINIYNKDKETIIGTINKECSVKNGNYVIDISTVQNNSLYIITSKPIGEGTIILDLEKAIKTDLAYSKEQLKEFNKMSVELEGKENKATMELKEPTSVASIELSKTDLTTVVKNENIEIRITLDNSDYNNALYKNPEIKIKLPKYINNVELKNYDILMASKLKIKNEPKIYEENGQKIIAINLEGMQEEYVLDAEYRGTIITLNTDLTVETLTPSNTDRIVMEFVNNNEASTNKNGSISKNINFVAPTGVVAANGIKGKTDVMTISSKGAVAEIDANSEKKINTIYGTVINNYPNTIEDVVILGRLPAKGNTNIDDENSLGSTFSTTLNKAVSVDGINKEDYKIYYSNNESANAKLEDSNNNWTETATKDAKSYMIVADECEIEPGQTVKFSYDVEVPEKVAHNNTAYEMYKVYYNNNSEIGTIEESKTSSIIAMTTGQGVELEASLKADTSVVRNGQIVKMIATVKNIGGIKATGVKVNIPVQPNTTFVNYVAGNGFYTDKSKTKTIDIGTLEAGKNYEISYFLKVNDYIEEDDDESTSNGETETQTQNDSMEIVNKINVVSDKLTGTIESNECKFEVKDGIISIEMVGDVEESQVLKKGDEIRYTIKLYNISGKANLENTVVTIKLPKGMEYKEAMIKDKISDSDDKAILDGVNYNEENRTLSVNIGTLNIQKVILLTTEIGEKQDSMKIFAMAKANNTEECYSNVTEYKSENINLEVSTLTATPRYVKDGNEITYNLSITNKGKSDIYDIKIQDELPQELDFIEATYIHAGKEQKVTGLTNKDVGITINKLGSNESKEVRIVAKAKLLENRDDKEITNFAIVSTSGINDIKTNSVTNVIEYNDQIHSEANRAGEVNNNTKNASQSNVSTGKYKITGVAWIDSNKDGKRDESESILENVQVVLLNKNDNSIVKDVDDNSEKRVLTGSNGKYEFNNLKTGEYIVLFIYDASKYSVTTYRAKDVASNLNSDAININMTLNGSRTIAATTDVINITNDNARDIDIGLYSSEKFDLKIDKYISKITLTTPTVGTKTYEYENSKLAKIEVLGKNVGKSSVAIEYKIIVTNEGAVPGYAKKIVDYLPEGVGFNTELNRDWYLSENGNVYNASLANTIIKPGESKELTLVVTKKITEDSLGTPLNNNAEIYESYNEQGLQDMDSNSGNKVQSEDDISKADVILSLVTGKMVTYTAVILGVVTLFGFGVYEIKNKVLRKRRRR